MKTLAKVLAVAMVASFLIIGNAMADYTNLNRSFTDFGTSTDPVSPVSYPSLSVILQSIADPDIDVAAQSDAAIWTSSGDGDMDAYTVMSGYRAHSGVLGIYSLSTGEKYDLVFNVNNKASFVVSGGELYIDDGATDMTFGQEFGFYWHNTTTGGYSYTEDSKNTGNGYGADSNILALAYQVPSSTVITTTSYNNKPYISDGDDWILAFEDLFKGRGDGDFNDAVFYIEDMKAATPEPGTMILLGAGLAGLAVLRKKFRK